MDIKYNQIYEGVDDIGAGDHGYAIGISYELAPWFRAGLFRYEDKRGHSLSYLDVNALPAYGGFLRRSSCSCRLQGLKIGHDILHLIGLNVKGLSLESRGYAAIHRLFQRLE
jgi:hypothetical protein